MQFPWKFEIGSAAPPEIRRETVKLSHLDQPFHVLYMSDLHLVRNKTRRLVEQLNQIIVATKPDLLLLGGDLVNEKAGLLPLSELISSARRTCLVGAACGNHDRRISLDLVQNTVRQAGGICLEKQPLTFWAGATRVVASGEAVRQAPHTEVSILCAHNPRSFANNRSPAHDLVFAGHLHGCQMNLFSWKDRFYPGAWFYRWNGLRFTCRKSVILICRGLRDAIPVRLNCPREVILCHCGPDR
jgi:uncharacterized protein